MNQKTQVTRRTETLRSRQGIINPRNGLFTKEIEAHFNRIREAVTLKEARLFISNSLTDDFKDVVFNSASELVRELLIPNLRDVIRLAGELVFKRVSKQFDIVRDNIIRVLLARENFLLERFGTDVINQAMRVLRNGLSKGLSPLSLAKQLRSFIGVSEKQQKQLDNQADRLRLQGLTEKEIEQVLNARSTTMSRLRAQAIARTELNNGFNQGNLLGMQQAQEEGLVSGAVLKDWITVGDHAVDNICRPLGRMKPIPMNETFTVPESGRTIDAPPAHINCRCTLIFIEPDDL